MFVRVLPVIVWLGRRTETPHAYLQDRRWYIFFMLGECTYTYKHKHTYMCIYFVHIPLHPSNTMPITTAK